MPQALGLAGAQLARLNFIQYEITIEQFYGNALYSAGTRKQYRYSKRASKTFHKFKMADENLAAVARFVNTRALLSGGKMMEIVSDKGFSGGPNCTQETTQLRSQDSGKESFMSLVIFVGTSR